MKFSKYESIKLSHAYTSWTIFCIRSVNTLGLQVTMEDDQTYLEENTFFNLFIYLYYVALFSLQSRDP